MNKIKVIKSDRIVTPSGLFGGYISFADGKITDIAQKAPAHAEIYDYTGLIVFPGIIDIHTHGGGGYNFKNSDEQAVILAADFHLRHGTTSIMPTLAASPFAEMKAAVAYIASTMRSNKSRSNILGVHMEGPYCSKAQCGALVPDFITEPIEADYKPLIEEYGNIVRRWTYAPENDKGAGFCRYLSDHNILPSAGHTDAVYEDMATAIENGCKTVTHLYSCTSTVTRRGGFRRLGVIESAYLRDELSVELISDGKHLPKELFQLAVKIKGVDKTIMVSDSIAYAGVEENPAIMPADAPTIVEDGVCKLKDRSAFAGSIITADKMLRFAVEDAGYSLCSAARMLSANPADLLGLKKGRLAPAFDADIVVFDNDYKVKKVFVAGNEI